MKTPPACRKRFWSLGLTLIELLGALVILVILFILLVPNHPRGRRKAVNSRMCTLEMSQVVIAIKSYESAYNRWPVTTNVEQSGMSDFTFGNCGLKTATLVTNGGPIEANNSELISIVMDALAFGDGRPTPNAGHTLNPQRNAWLNAKNVSDLKSPGFGLDGVYRDPWGNPYIITIDLNRDGHCRDSIYSVDFTSGTQVTTPGTVIARTFEATNANPSSTSILSEHFIVWSLGPDGKADPKKKPDEGVNKDNVLSWR